MVRRSVVRRSVVSTSSRSAHVGVEGKAGGPQGVGADARGPVCRGGLRLRRVRTGHQVPRGIAHRVGRRSNPNPNPNPDPNPNPAPDPKTRIPTLTRSATAGATETHGRTGLSWAACRRYCSRLPRWSCASGALTADRSRMRPRLRPARSWQSRSRYV